MYGLVYTAIPDCVDDILQHQNFFFSFFFTIVAGDTILKSLIEINLYSKIYIDNIHSKYIVLSF